MSLAQDKKSQLLNWIFISINICLFVVAFDRSPLYAVDVWLTTGDKSSLLEEQQDLLFQPGSGSGGFTINVTPSTTYQTVQGFGAALTDSSAWLIENELNSSQRNDLMNMLFDSELGIGISYLRLPMGASDFTASGFYTYNDLPSWQTDVAQNQFSISHDQQYIIPQLQQALAINPDLKLMGSPWSAPAWMKTSGSVIGGSLQSQYYSSYATYLKKYIEAYAAEGISIDAITLQNEPLSTPTNYPSMSMTSAEQIDLVKNHVGPTFDTANIDTKLVLYDHNWDNTSYAINALNDPNVKQYVAGTAFHGYAGDVSAQTTVHNAHPDKEIYFTEITGGDWATNFADNLVWGVENVIIGNGRNWGQSALYWNLALNENNGPHLGGCSGCRGVVTIDSSTGGIALNEEYYIIAHASKFVQPGAVRVDSRTIENIVETVAFENPDGSKVVIALNPSSSSKSFRIVEGGEHFSYQLPSESVVTFKWPSETVPPGPQELLTNPGFEDSGSGWSSTGQAGFHDFFGGNGHASLFTDNIENSGSIFQTGIEAQPGQTFKFELSDTRIEENADANVQFGLEFWGVGESSKIGEEMVVLDLPGHEVNGGVYSMTGTAPAGTQFVRPIAWFDNVVSSGPQRNIFFFDASLTQVFAPADFDLDGDVDGDDLLIWENGFGVDASGDANGNGITDGLDFLAWQRQFTGDLGSASTLSSIPEPATVCNSIAALVLCSIFRLQRRVR